MEQVKVYLTDRCNFHCRGCHWFSEPVTEVTPPGVEVYREALARLGVRQVFFTGGEPTLREDFAEIVDGVAPLVEQVVIHSNGSNPARLKETQAKNVRLMLSVHSKSRPSVLREVRDWCSQAGWKLLLVGFQPFALEQLPELKVRCLPHQLQPDTQPVQLLGKRVRCRPRVPTIATDGHAYWCERGLRSKDERFRAGWGLDYGTAHTRFNHCVVEQSCLSCFVGEQEVIVDDDGAPA